MYSIGKKDGHEVYGTGHLTWQSPAFRWQARNVRLRSATTEPEAQGEVAPPAFQRLLKQLAAQEEEVITLALRHARSSESFLDRMRGRYRQLLLPLQVETHRAIQFLMLQALAITCERSATPEAFETLVQQVCTCPADTLRTDLADYFAHPSAPGEVFAHNVWELIQGPREKERFAVFALRMESCFRRLLADVVPVLEALTTTDNSVALGASAKGD